MSQKVEILGATMKNRPSMTTLYAPKLVENKFSKTSRLSRLVLHKKLCRADFSKVNSTARYQSYSNFTVENVHLCPAHLCCKIAQLLYEVPSLRVTSVCLGARCVSICDLVILGSIGAKRGHVSTKFNRVQIFHLHHDDLGPTKTCRKQIFQDLSPI